MSQSIRSSMSCNPWRSSTHHPCHPTSWWTGHLTHLRLLTTSSPLLKKIKLPLLRTLLQNISFVYHPLQNSCGYQVAMKLEFLTQIGRYPTSPSQLSRVVLSLQRYLDKLPCPSSRQKPPETTESIPVSQTPSLMQILDPQVSLSQDYERRDKPYFDRA